MSLIAVYGTLKKGERANYMLDTSVFLGECVVTGFKMGSIGAYPYLFKASPDHSEKVLVEVYDVNEEDGSLRSIENYEGYPHYYQKAKVETDFGEADVFILEGLAGSKEPSRENIYYGDFNGVTYFSSKG